MILPFEYHTLPKRSSGSNFLAGHSEST